MTSTTAPLTTTPVSTNTGFLRAVIGATATIAAVFCVLAVLWH